MAATTAKPVPAPPRPAERRMLTVVSVMVLIGAEVFGVALASAWAIAGLFELGPHVGYGLMAAFAAIGAWIMTKVWHRALAADARR